MIVEALEINEKHCSELITIENPENNEKISYPCNLGQDCDIKTKQQLTIFLVVNEFIYIFIFIYYNRLKTSKIDQNIIFNICIF